MKKLSLIYSLELFPLFNIFTRKTATVFAMHHFCKWGERPRGLVPVLPADMLDNRLRYLNKNKYSVIPLSEYIHRLENGGRLYKTVVFTIDDGYGDFYEYAYPIFKKYDTPAAVFIVSDFVDGKTGMWWDRIESAIRSTREKEIDIDFDGRKLFFPLRASDERKVAANEVAEYCKTVSQEDRIKIVDKIAAMLCATTSERKSLEIPRPLTWDQIREMKKNHIEFFPHTKTHPILSQCGDETVRTEISESKKRIETELGTSADIFCYPNGRLLDFDDRIVTLLQESGYRAAFTTQAGHDSLQDEIDLFRLKRYLFPDDFLLFKRLVSGLEQLISIVQSSTKRNVF